MERHLNFALLALGFALSAAAAHTLSANSRHRLRARIFFMGSILLMWSQVGRQNDAPRDFLPSRSWRLIHSLPTNRSPWD